MAKPVDMNIPQMILLALRDVRWPQNFLVVSIIMNITYMKKVIEYSTTTVQDPDMP